MGNTFIPVKLNLFAPFCYKEGVVKQVGGNNNLTENNIIKLFKDNIISSSHVQILDYIGMYNCLTGYQIKLLMRSYHINVGNGYMRISKAISGLVSHGLITRRYLDYINTQHVDSADAEEEDENLPPLDKMEKRSVYFYSLTPGTVSYLNNKHEKKYDYNEIYTNSDDILTCLSTNQFIAVVKNRVTDREIRFLTDRKVVNPFTNIAVKADAFIYDKDKEYILFNFRRTPDWINVLSQRIQSIPFFITELYGNPNSTLRPVIIIICQDDTQIVESYPVIKKYGNHGCPILFTTDMRVANEFFSDRLIHLKEEGKNIILNEYISPLTNKR